MARRQFDVLDPHELFAEVFADHPDMRVAWPDELVELRVHSAVEIRARLGDAIAELCRIKNGAALVADVHFYPERWRLDVRIVAIRSRSAEVEVDAGGRRARARVDALRRRVERLHDLLTRCGGLAEEDDNGAYVDVRLPVFAIRTAGPPRLEFPRLPENEWDARYREALRVTTWHSLRIEAYRFSRHATAIAEWCVQAGASRVLIPQVGLCVHPYLFADRGLDVVATDGSRVALEVLAHPERLPRVYGAAAKERWDQSESVAYASWNPDRFEPMPAIERSAVAQVLRSRMEFLKSDWTALPLVDASVDAIFATNALPRHDDALRVRVLQEWARVVRRGGLVFVQMHNPGLWPEVEELFVQRGWHRVSALTGDRGPEGVSVFETHRSSG